MPIYAYKCSSCGHAQDVLRKVSDAPLTSCPQCGAEAYSKQVTAAGFQLRGSGWYATDFKNGSKPDKTGSTKPDQAGSTKPDQTGSTKPDQTGSAKPDQTGSKQTGSDGAGKGEKVSATGTAAAPCGQGGCAACS
jgi:putative FmdB family regulatory protein